MNNLYFICQKV